MKKKFLNLEKKIALSLLTLSLVGCQWNGDFPDVRPGNMCPKTPIAAGNYKTSPGCFDYLVFSQLWIPESCIYFQNLDSNATRESSYSCENLDRKFEPELTPHGLWPNFYSTSLVPAGPAFCSKEEF